MQRIESDLRALKRWGARAQERTREGAGENNEGGGGRLALSSRSMVYCYADDRAAAASSTSRLVWSTLGDIGACFTRITESVEAFFLEPLPPPPLPLLPLPPRRLEPGTIAAGARSFRRGKASSIVRPVEPL